MDELDAIDGAWVALQAEESANEARLRCTHRQVATYYIRCIALRSILTRSCTRAMATRLAHGVAVPI